MEGAPTRSPRPAPLLSPLPQPATFRQRYFLCADHYAGPGSPILFYAGNEADVTLYVNASGLMWESAPALGAALVFAEHRYEGLSIPTLLGVPNCLAFCIAR